MLIPELLDKFYEECHDVALLKSKLDVWREKIQGFMITKVRKRDQSSAERKLIRSRSTRLLVDDRILLTV